MNSAFSFNPMDPQLLADPYPIFRQMRENDPVHRSDLGFLVMTRYEDCRHVLIDKTFGQGDFVRNIQLFYDADFDVLSHPAYAWLSRVFVMQDPPQHTRVRDLVAGALTHKRVREMAPPATGISYFKPSETLLSGDRRHWLPLKRPLSNRAGPWA